MGYIWRKINVWFAKETTRWTAVAPSIWTPKASLDFEDKSEKVIDESSIGVIEDSFDWHVVKEYAEGNFECNVYANSIGYLLLNLFGAVSTTSSSGKYTHAFTVAETNAHQSLTIGLADDTQDRQFALAMLDSLDVNASVWDFVKATASFRSKKSTTASLTPSYSTDIALLGKHVKVYIADDLTWLSTATAISAISSTLTISKNLEDVDVLWSTVPEDFCNTQFWVEWTLELKWDNETYKTIYQNWVKKAMRIEIADSVNWVSLTFDLASVIMTEFAKTQDNDALVKQSLTFKALYSMSDSSMISAKLINTHSSY